MKTLVCSLIISLAITSNCLAEPLRIGFIGALSGDSAVIGRGILQTLEHQVEEINNTGGIVGRQIELIVEDDGYNITRSRAAFEKVKDSINSQIIFLSTYGAAFVIAPRAKESGLLLIDTLDCNDELAKLSPALLCVATRTESIADVFITEIKSSGRGGKVGLVFESEAWFDFIVTRLRAALREDLIESLAPAQAFDYRANLLQLKRSGVKHIVFLGGDSMGRAMKQARELGMGAQFYSIAGVMSPGFRDLAGAALEGAIVSNWEAAQSPAAEKFRNSYAAKFGAPPQLEFVAGPTADAFKAVTAGLRAQLGGSQSIDTERLRKSVIENGPFAGVSGQIRFDSDGAVRSILERAYVYRSGKLEMVRREMSDPTSVPRYHTSQD